MSAKKISCTYFSSACRIRASQKKNVRGGGMTGKFFDTPLLRNDIKSYGKFAIFSKLMIEGGWLKSANFGKIKTKDRGL